MGMGWKPFTVQVSLTTMLIGIGLLLAASAGGIVAWEQQNSNGFCTYTCHAVHPEEPRAHDIGVHARVQCVECHEGRLPTLELMAAKLEHVNQLWLMMVGWERPGQATTLRPLRDSCEGCHWPQVVHDDSVRVKARYDIDEASTETRYMLTLHTGSGTIRNKKSKGIHWHITQKVDYFAIDPLNQKIALVVVHNEDGSTKEYFDSTLGITRAEVPEKTHGMRMQCVDCHSSVGHQFRNPADVVDEAIATGEIDRELPWAKARALELIGKADQLRGTAQELAPKIEKLVDDAVPQAVRASDELEDQFATVMKRILLQSSFSAKGYNWKSFPFNTGHKDFPGCFRCHDGKHEDAKGDTIQFQCNICHALPQAVREGGVRSVPSTLDPDDIEPRSHRNSNWMRDHAIQQRDSCEGCHGKIEVGKNGGSFCSNPACHGREWPAIVTSRLPVGGDEPAKEKGSPVAANKQ